MTFPFPAMRSSTPRPANEAIWPAQIAEYVLGAATLALARPAPEPEPGRQGGGRPHQRRGAERS
jgi:hypothetical protein